MVAVRHGPPRLHNLRNSPSTEQVDGHDVCRVNVPRATEPMWSTFKDNEKLFVRRNNSTRAVPDGEIETFITERFGPDHATSGEET
jgi:hypothetical protein